MVLFDGLCNLCSGSVDFAVRHGAGNRFRFVPLQSEAGARILEGAGGTGDPTGTVILVDGEGTWTESDAALRIARRLRAPYRWLRFFTVIPRPIRDAVYRIVARNRYRLFGKRDTCRAPWPPANGPTP